MGEGGLNRIDKTVIGWKDVQQHMFSEYDTMTKIHVNMLVQKNLCKAQPLKAEITSR